MKSRPLVWFLPLFLGSVQVGQADGPHDYFGRWRITSVEDYAQVAAMSDVEARRNVGRYFVMTKDLAALGRYKCKPRYRLSNVEPEKNLRDGYGISNDVLKLPNPVRLVDTGCQFVYVKNNEQIIIEKSGVFFRAVRGTR